MQKRPTIKDIAAALGVSVSTISRGLKDHPDISLDLRTAIKEKAKEHNYHPNHLASGLRMRKSKFIGLIIPEITMFFFPSVIKGIEEVAKQNGYQLLVLQSNDSKESEKVNIQICLDQFVDGLMVSLSNQSQDVDHFSILKEAGIPVVLFDKSIDNSPFDEVIIDDVKVAYQATCHLIEKGSRRIVAALGNENLSISKKRMAGIKQALRERGLEDAATFISAASFEEGKHIIAKTLDELRPDGLFLMSDELIASATHGLSKTYGSDYAQCNVIGFSDGLLPQIIEYPISYVHHSGIEIGRLAAKKLMERLFLITDEIEPEEASRMMLKVEIVEPKSISL